LVTTGEGVIFKVEEGFDRGLEIIYWSKLDHGERF
jgi:hypothetical protein